MLVIAGKFHAANIRRNCADCAAACNSKLLITCILFLASEGNDMILRQRDDYVIFPVML